MNKEEEKIYDYLIDNTIATEDQVNLVCCINGTNKESLNDILFVKSGYRNINQFEESKFQGKE